MPSLMMKLKQGTWPLHQQLEQSLDLLNPRFSVADYRRLIEAFWGYYQPLEARLQAHQALREGLPDLAQRAKWPLLEADLLALGRAEVPPRLNVVELSSKVPSPHGNGVELSLPAYQLVGRQPFAAETSRGFSRHGGCRPTNCLKIRPFMVRQAHHERFNSTTLSRGAGPQGQATMRGWLGDGRLVSCTAHLAHSKDPATAPSAAVKCQFFLQPC